MANLASTFGNAVRAHRKARGLTQAKLAEATSMSEEWIRRLERGAGTPSFDAIEALANALSVSPSEFFELSQPKALRLSALDAKLLHLSDSELNWIFDLIKVAVAHKDYK